MSRNERRRQRRAMNGAVSPEEEEMGDPAVWETLDLNFQEVQTVLDRNRALIQQVNENHHSRLPDNMVKNVSLIREINGNISRVASMYSDLSTNFSTMVRQRANKEGFEGGAGSMA